MKLFPIQNPPKPYTYNIKYISLYIILYLFIFLKIIIFTIKYISLYIYLKILNMNSKTMNEDERCIQGISFPNRELADRKNDKDWRENYKIFCLNACEQVGMAMSSK